MHGDPGIKYQQHACRQCGLLVLQDPTHLKQHLASHELTLATYTELVTAQENLPVVNDITNDKEFDPEAEVASTMSSTSKSSPGVASDCFTEASGHSILPDDLELKDCDESLNAIDDNFIGIREENSDEDLEMSDIENIETEPDINVGLFDNDEINGDDVEMTITPNIIRNISTSEQYFFQSQAFKLPKAFIPSFQTPRKVPWYHGCLFQCAIPNCHRQFFDKAFLKSHVESQHEGITYEQYSLNFGNSNNIIHYHECEICGTFGSLLK